MNALQSRKYSAYLAIKTVCDRYSATYSNHQAFKRLYTQFTGHIENIRALGQIRAARNTGVAEDKQRLRTEMCEAALDVASATRACAVAARNRELAARVDFSRSDLLSGRAVDSAEDCQNIHAAASAHLGALEPYGVTAASLADLNTKIEAYAAILPKPRASIVSGKTATKTLREEFQAADEVLTEGLDKLVRQFKSSQPAFVEDYFNARTILDRPATSKSPENTVAVAIPQAQTRAA